MGMSDRRGDTKDGNSKFQAACVYERRGKDYMDPKLFVPWKRGMTSAGYGRLGSHVM